MPEFQIFRWKHAAGEMIYYLVHVLKPTIKASKLSLMLCIWRPDWRFERLSAVHPAVQLYFTIKVYLKIWGTLSVYGQFISRRILTGEIAKHVSAQYFGLWGRAWNKMVKLLSRGQTKQNKMIYEPTAIIRNQYLKIPTKKRARRKRLNRWHSFTHKLAVVLKLACKSLMLEIIFIKL